MADEPVTISLVNNDWQIVRLALVNSELPARAILPTLHRLEEQLKAKAEPEEEPPLVQRMTGGQRK